MFRLEKVFRSSGSLYRLEAETEEIVYGGLCSIKNVQQHENRIASDVFDSAKQPEGNLIDGNAKNFE